MEKEFQEWYSKWSKMSDIDPNPDHYKHYYDYRAAFKAGAEPKWNEDLQSYKWDSKFKDDLHPNRYIFENDKWLDTKYNKEAAIEDILIQSIKRKEFESNQIMNR